VQQLLVLGRGVDRRQRRGRRLDAEAGFEELAHQAVREMPVEDPGEDFGVEQVPLVFGVNISADARTLADESLGGQDLHRFAQHRAAGAELLAELGFDRQGFSGRQYATTPAKRRRIIDPINHRICMQGVTMRAST
jgi:hypothetical protein